MDAGTFRFRDPLNQQRRFIPLRIDDTPIKGPLAQFLFINWLPTAGPRARVSSKSAVRQRRKHSPLGAEFLAAEAKFNTLLPTSFSVFTEHQMHPSGDPVKFSLKRDESNGTQRFFALAGPILDALESGFVLVIDELDCSMHPNLTRKIIELFQSPEMNTKGAQLIFATHDSSLMQSNRFRRDQIWLTEKRRDGSTDLFSLNDIDSDKRPRNAEALERNYLVGRYGAVPKFGPTLEDLEVR